MINHQHLRSKMHGYELHGLIRFLERADVYFTYPARQFS